MATGKFIVIDGADGSGKHTQTQLIVEKLNISGHSTETIDFPRKQNFFGRFIYQCLEEGVCGDFTKVDPKIASVLYANDRNESKSQIVEWLKSGKNVVADRYVSANQIHQGGKIANEEDRKKFLQWLDEMEHGILGLPRPDKVFYLDVPYAISLQLMKKQKEKVQEEENQKRRKEDQHENSPEHQLAARESAITMLSNNSWIRIQCSDDGQTILPKEVIHERILEHCLKIL